MLAEGGHAFGTAQPNSSPGMCFPAVRDAKAKYTFAHGDAQHMSDLDPSRPGMEIWSIHENPPAERSGVELRNARTER